jgi:hypothetical protein
MRLRIQEMASNALRRSHHTAERCQGSWLEQLPSFTISPALGPHVAFCCVQGRYLFNVVIGSSLIYFTSFALNPVKSGAMCHHSEPLVRSIIVMLLQCQRHHNRLG